MLNREDVIEHLRFKGVVESSGGTYTDPVSVYHNDDAVIDSEEVVGKHVVWGYHRGDEQANSHFIADNLEKYESIEEAEADLRIEGEN